jgi:hypothetical protein
MSLPLPLPTLRLCSPVASMPTLSRGAVVGSEGVTSMSTLAKTRSKCTVARCRMRCRAGHRPRRQCQSMQLHMQATGSASPACALLCSGPFLLERPSSLLQAYTTQSQKHVPAMQSGSNQGSQAWPG